MVDLVPVGFGAFLSVIAVALAHNAWRSWGDYQTVQRAESDLEEPLTPGAVTTVNGPVRVFEPAVAPEAPFSIEDEHSSRPGVIAWRVREQRRRRSGNSSGGRTRWKTTDGDIILGSIGVEDADGVVTVDPASFPQRDTGLLGGDSDPFEMDNLHLESPQIEADLGTGGPFGDTPLTISAGGFTNTPDRFQATIITEGDPLLIHGELHESNDQYTIRAPDDGSLLVVQGTVDEARNRLKKQLITNTGIALAVFIIGSAILVTGIY